MFVFFVTSCVGSAMAPLVISSLHFETLTTFDGRKMMPSVNLKNFGIGNFCITPPPPHHNHFMALFQDHPGEPVPEEKFWTLWCKGRLTDTDTPTIRLGATPYGPTNAHLHHPCHFLQARCPSCHPTNSVKALETLYL